MGDNNYWNLFAGTYLVENGSTGLVVETYDLQPDGSARWDVIDPDEEDSQDSSYQGTWNADEDQIRVYFPDIEESYMETYNRRKDYIFEDSEVKGRFIRKRSTYQ